MKYCPVCAKHGFSQVPVMQGSAYCSDCDMEREAAQRDCEADRYNAEEYD